MICKLNKMNAKTKRGTILLLASLVALGTFTVVAQADAQGNRSSVRNEEFHSNSRPVISAPTKREPQPGEPGYENPLGKQGALAMMSNPNDPVVLWFEDFDNKVVAWSKTQYESTVLGRGFNQEAERVQQWTDTASKVVVKYRMLAQILRKMDVPPGKPGLREYCDLTADWYSDSADIYEDLIKPRKAAKTMEELEDGLDGIHNRAKGLKEQQANLRAMDMELRKSYHVHMRIYDDALQQFVKVIDPAKQQQQGVGGNPPR